MSALLLERAQAVRLAVFDVDGVLTDGSLHYLPDGTEIKTFNTLDGLGIKLLIAAGIRTAIITGARSAAIERRAQVLGIQHLMQGREDKLVALDELLKETGFSHAQTAYLGDDLPDVPAIRRVALGMSVPNATPWVREQALGVTRAAGGQGAAREFCELILSAQGLWADVQARFA